MTATVRIPATVSTRVMSPKSRWAGRYHASSPGGYTSGEPGGIVDVSGVAYGLSPLSRLTIASCVARSTSLPSRNGIREMRSDQPMRIASHAVSIATCVRGAPATLTPRRTAPATSSSTRSSCGALSSIPPTHQKMPARIAASLARECTKSGEVVFEGLLLGAVRREVAVPQRGLRLRVMVRRALHDLRDRRGRRRPPPAPAPRAGRRGPLGDRRAAEQRRERVREAVGHRDAVLRREDHPLQLGELPVRRLHEQRLDV